MAKHRVKPPWTALLAFLLLVLLSAPGRAAEPRTATLDNGFTVVVQRLDRSPVVAVQVWVKAGSRLEGPAEKGLTHQIEHMIFKGTPTRGLGQVAGQIEEAGGRINAYTSFDHTVYHVLLPADKWALGVEVLGDAVKNSLFDAEELAKEKEVVLEEWRRGQDSPQRALSEKVFETVFRSSPYRFPIIGTEETIRNFNRQQILDYMARWYTANRAGLVVVGQVDPDQVLAKAKEVFSDFRSGPGATFVPPQEPAQEEMKLEVFQHRVKQAYLALAFRTHGFNDPRTPATDLLAELLGGSQAARLVEDIWGKQALVRSIHASSFTPLDEGVFWISATLEPNKLEEALRAIWSELQRATLEPFSPQEMARTKLAFKASFVRDKETMEGQASKLGYFLLLAGGLDREAAYLARIEALRPEEIRRRAARIFRPENLTLVVMLPEGDQAPPGERLRAIFTPLPQEANQNRTLGEPASSGRIAPPPPGPNGPPEVQVLSLPGGTKLIVAEDHSLPLVAVEAVFLGGNRLEPADQAGAFQLMSSCWTRGAAGLGAEELARRVEDMAARLTATSGRNTISLSGEFLSQSFEEGLELMVQVMLRPDFPAEEVAKRKADQLASIKAKEEQPALVAFRLFAENMYQGHPYARDPLGTAASLERLDQDRLKALHRATVKSENLVLAVVGDVKAETVQKKLTALLAPLSRGFNPLWPDLPPPLPEGGLSVDEVRPGQAQTHTLLGFRGTSMREAGNYALDLLAEALSNQSGRLFIELRDQKSLAYALAAFNSAGLDLGSFGFYVAHAPEKTESVKEELLKQVEQIRAQGLTEKELVGARARLLAQWILDRQSFGDRARDLALYDRLGLGWDYARSYGEIIKSLTAEEILAAAQEYLDLSRPLWVRVGPEEEETEAGGEGE